MIPSFSGLLIFIFTALLMLNLFPAIPDPRVSFAPQSLTSHCGSDKMISDTNVYFCNRNISLQTGEARKMVANCVREQIHKFALLFWATVF